MDIIDLLPVLMFAALGLLLFSGYPVAFVLGGVALGFSALGIYYDVFVPLQLFNLLPRIDALQNVELPLVYSRVARTERHRRAQAALEAVGLGNRVHHRPNEMSGGQRQRVAVARALVNNPAILLADEPTGNLDSKTGAEIMALLDDLHSKGNTIVLVTHEEELAERASRVIRLRDGEITFDERNRPLVAAPETSAG